MRILLWLFFKVIHIFYVPLFFVRLFQKSKKCPPVQDPILLLSATALAEKIRLKELTSEAVVKCYIARIQEVDPIINAVVETRFSEALKEAKEIDKILASNEPISNKPLLGVPITVKESIAVKGMSCNAGRICNRPTTAEDAEIVGYARNAGAIPLLVSNTPELCMNWETYNKVTGRTSNPYDTTKTAGGSSGGEATLLASAASVIGLGSDICGSLRLPAHFCGVWGHKPSAGAVSSKGHYPDCTNKEAWKNYFTLGPMARYAVDLPLLLKVIVNPEYKELLDLDRVVDFEKINVYYMDTFDSMLVHSVSPEIQTCIKKVVTHFEVNFGSSCKKLDIKEFKYVPEWVNLILLELNGVDYICESKIGVWKEALKYILCMSNSVFLTVFYGLLKQFLWVIPKSNKEASYRSKENVDQKFADELGNNGILLLPSFASTAHPHFDIFKKIFDTSYLAVFNVLGLPVTNCPISFDSNGLPIGIQVVANKNCDRLTLAVAQEIEKAFGGWSSPTAMKKKKNEVFA